MKAANRWIGVSGRYLLDTNIVIALFAHDATVVERIADVDEVFVSSIVIGELYYGAQKSGQVQTNTTRVDEFAGGNLVLNCDVETARRYGEIKAELRRQGRPLPENDIWIAAVALQSSLTLASRDEHFGQVDNLNVERW
jgi:tRNA(fMet)-specific endonuclease VapC